MIQILPPLHLAVYLINHVLLHLKMVFHRYLLGSDALTTKLAQL